jgi:dipeptidyl aminopeptidase/acylaminoacyl peptidase
VYFAVADFNYERNKGKSSIQKIDLLSGKTEIVIEDEVSVTEPALSPDNKFIAYVSAKTGIPQVYLYDINLKTSKAISSISSGVSGIVWSPDGKKIAFTSDVYPDCLTDECNKIKSDSVEHSKIKARLLTNLPYRVWTSWKDDKRSHLFVLDIESGKSTDVTPGNYDTPPIDIGGNHDYTFSPDSREICYVKNTDKMVAISTNNDLFTVSLIDLSTKRITENKAADNQPVYSPDGNYIAYKAMKRPGFEADKYSLMLYDRKNGNIRNLTEKLDLSIDEVVWNTDSKELFFTVNEKLNSNLYKIDIEGKYKKIIENNYISTISTASDGTKLICLNQSLNNPVEIHEINLKSLELKKLTHINDELLSNISMNAPEEFSFVGAAGAKVEGFIVKPPDFNPSKKYPMIYLVHGGPQGAWLYDWSYRWNPQMFAAPGYVVVCVNPRGSTGYGQKFCDEISGDWGGKVFTDLMKGVDYVVGKYPYIDKDKLAAAGASYGGYMMNWFLGHTQKFKCIVSHAGVYNLESMYGTTEEIWFPEWEFRGTPWDKPENYTKYSPHKYAKYFKTPTLVIHGEMDYRVPVSEGMQLFTALQRNGVKSKFLCFPDEGHWVQKPQNLRLWFNTMYDWFKDFLQY